MVSPWQEAFCYGGQSRSVTHFTGHLQPQTSRMKLLTLPSSPHLSQPHRGQHRLYGLQTRTPHSFAFPAACSVGQPCLPGQGAACSSTAVPPEGLLSLLWSVSVASRWVSSFSPAFYSLFSAISQRAPLKCKYLAWSVQNQKCPLLSLGIRAMALPWTPSPPAPLALIHSAPLTPAALMFLEHTKRTSAPDFNPCPSPCLESSFPRFPYGSFPKFHQVS